MSSIRFDSIEQAPNDHYTYDHFRLDQNGLQVMLIGYSSKENNNNNIKNMTNNEMCKKNQPNTTRQTCVAMCIEAGSFNDPENPQFALAHLLEHLLFMGSAAYPGRNDWDAQIAKDGGETNAYTDAEHTVYHWTMPKKTKKVAQALDIFAQFFVEPLLAADRIDDEIDAVDSEFVMDLQNDVQRLHELKNATARKGHPQTRFSYGNAATLRDEAQKNGIDIRSELCKFFENFYSAERMHLVVITPDPDALKSVIEQSFSKIPRRGAPVDMRHWGMPYGPESLQHYFHVSAIRDIHTMTVTWALPSLFNEYRTKPSLYGETLLGHEGPNSLFSLLRMRGLVTSISAGTSTDGYSCNSICWQFCVCFTLTESGFEQRDQIMKLLFAFINFIRAQPIQEYIWNEMRDISDLSWRFWEHDDPEDYADMIAVNLTLFPVQHVLRGPTLYENFDPAKIRAILDLLTPFNCRIDVLSQHFNESVPLTAPHFGTKYDKVRIPESVLAEWVIADLNGIPVGFPPKNPFISSNFDLIPVPPFPSKDAAAENGLHLRDIISIRKRENRHRPLLIHQNAHFELFHAFDTLETPVPRYDANCVFETPAVYSDVSATVCSLLFTQLVSDYALELVYQASLADLSCSVSSYRAGIEIKFSGYSDKLGVLICSLFRLLNEVLESMSADTEHPIQSHMRSRFPVILESAIRSYKHMFYGEPSKQVGYAQLLTLQHEKWHVEDLTAVCEKTCFEDVRKFACGLLRSAFARFLFHGNITPEAAIKLAYTTVDMLHWTPMLPENFRAEHVCLLPANHTTKLLMQSRSATETNNAVEIYYMIGSSTPYLRAVCYLLENIMVEPFFDELRTQRKFGYAVSCELQSLFGCLGFAFAIETHNFTPDEAVKAIQTWLCNFYSRIKQLTNDELQERAQSLIDLRLVRPNNASELTNVYWSEITEHAYHFDRRFDEALALFDITVSDIIRVYECCFLGMRNDNNAFDPSFDGGPCPLIDAFHHPLALRSLFIQVYGCHSLQRTPDSSGTIWSDKIPVSTTIDCSATSEPHSVSLVTDSSTLRALKSSLVLLAEVHD